MCWAFTLVSHLGMKADQNRQHGNYGSCVSCVLTAKKQLQILQLFFTPQLMIHASSFYLSFYLSFSLCCPYQSRRSVNRSFSASVDSSVIQLSVLEMTLSLSCCLLSSISSIRSSSVPSEMNLCTCTSLVWPIR